MVITFGTDGAYGHPDHIAICEATARACALVGASDAYPEQIAAGLALNERWTDRAGELPGVYRRGS